MADASIHAGAVDPYKLTFVVSSDDADFDLSTVTSAVFRIKRGSGKVEEWSAAIEGVPAADEITIAHTFASGEIPDADEIAIEPRLTTPIGVFVVAVKTLEVRAPFE